MFPPRRNSKAPSEAADSRSGAVGGAGGTRSLATGTRRRCLRGRRRRACILDGAAAARVVWSSREQQRDGNRCFDLRTRRQVSPTIVRPHRTSPPLCGHNARDRVGVWPGRPVNPRARARLPITLAQIAPPLHFPHRFGNLARVPLRVPKQRS